MYVTDEMLLNLAREYTPTTTLNEGEMFVVERRWCATKRTPNESLQRTQRRHSQVSMKNRENSQEIRSRR